MTKTKIYISGPITGMPDGNAKAFDEAEGFLTSLGHKAINPRYLNQPGESWHDCMKRDLSVMLACDELAVLPGWENSKGAALEVEIAHRLLMPVREVYSGSTILPPDERSTKATSVASETILAEAHRIVTGHRQDSYNHPLDNFTGIARLWSAHLNATVTAEDVALMMILLKIAREGFKHSRDNVVDIAGYAQCLDMVVEERERRAKKSSS